MACEHQPVGAASRGARVPRHSLTRHSLKKFFRLWRRDQRGNVMLMFGLAFVPLMVAAGAAVDVSRAYIVQSRLTQALDAAGLAVGSMIGLTEAEMQQRAEDYFNANYSVNEIGIPATPVVSLVDEVVTLSVAAKLPTAIMRIVGINELDIHSSVEITRESKNLELMMVLDNTGSMNNNGKIDALKTAANDLIGILFGNEAFPAKVKVGLVPFAAGVNVGTAFQASGYMDMNAQSSIHSENFTPGTNLWTLYNKISNRTWDGCVQTRPDPLDEDDTQPSIGNPDTLWVPWFAPDEPDLSGYSNKYLSDGVSGTADQRQRSTVKYNGTSASPSSKGPQYGCDVEALTPLTNDRDGLLQKIAAMVATGYTHIPIGLAWGWRLLSPTPPFTEGVAYGAPDTTKAIILLTDGENTIPSKSNHNKSDYTGYGYLAQGRLGTTNASTAENKLDQKTSTICSNVKAAGIRVYTVTFQLNNTATQNMMRACATEPSLYYDSPSNAQLRLVFQNIAQDLSNLRLSR